MQNNDFDLKHKKEKSQNRDITLTKSSLSFKSINIFLLMKFIYLSRLFIEFASINKSQNMINSKIVSTNDLIQ